ncbi:MAG: TolB protein [Acidobacteriales bacterium]|nr:TolB protein [Terriglobales bacterium]
MLHSILTVGGTPELTILRNQVLIARGFSVVSVSHVTYAVPVFHSSNFNAVILCYTATENMSNKELMAMTRQFKAIPVLGFNREISPEQDNLLLISPRTSELKGNGEAAQLVSDLQSLFRLETAVPGSLQSWKEISAYMNRGIRTLQRWERDFGLPIHRPSKHDRSAVFALKPEIDEWMKNTRKHRETETTREEPVKMSRAA